MSNVNNKNISLEILISTKDRDNLDFLNSIFINKNPPRRGGVDGSRPCKKKNRSPL